MRDLRVDRIKTKRAWLETLEPPNLESSAFSLPGKGLNKKTFWLLLLPLACGAGILFVADSVIPDGHVEHPSVVINNHPSAHQAATSISLASHRTVAPRANSPLPEMYANISKKRLVADVF
jgi:hypothetical protein